MMTLSPGYQKKSGRSFTVMPKIAMMVKSYVTFSIATDSP